MTASSSASSSVAFLALLACGGCVQDDRALMSGTTSLQVTISSPTNLGSDQNRLPDTQRQVTFTVKALDEKGAFDTSFSAQVDVWTYFLGTLSPPSKKLTVTNGMGSMTTTLPQSFGPTYLWIEDTSDVSNGRQPTYATGTTPTLWYRDALTSDIETPDLASTDASDWLDHEPFEGKQVTVSASRYGVMGKLMVTGVYSSGYTVSDVNCLSIPCIAQGFDHIFVYTFGLPRDDTGAPVLLGQTIDWYSGGIGEFNGYTEVNFPQQHIKDKTQNLQYLPQPVVIDGTWIKSANFSDQVNGALNMEKSESGLMEVDNGIVCPLDSDYTTYQQWKLDVGNGCRTAINVITAGQLAFDPSGYIGQHLPKVVGTLKTVNIGTFNVWILLPRVASDVVTP